MFARLSKAAASLFGRGELVYDGPRREAPPESLAETAKDEADTAASVRETDKAVRRARESAKNRERRGER